MSIAWYRFRATFVRHGTSYLTVALLIALLGGLAMASVAGARRTQSSYPTFLASTNPSTVSMTVYDASGSALPGLSLERRIARLPDVLRVRTLDTVEAAPLSPTGQPQISQLGSLFGSTDGLFVRQDRLVAASGRLFNPRRADEIVITEAAARLDHLHVGETRTIGFFKNVSANGVSTGVKRLFTQRVTLTGIVDINSQVVQDDVDKTFGFVIISPALLQRAIRADPADNAPVYFGIQLRPGVTIADAERSLIAVVPRGFIYQFHVTAQVEHSVELAIKPESIALGAFGAIAALVCLILAAQALARQLRRGARDRLVLRSLGARPVDTFLEGALGALGSVLLGTLGAVVVALALSPLFPIGPVRPVYPDRGFSVDPVVLGVGAALLLLALGTVTLLLARRGAPHRASRLLAPRTVNLTRRAQAVGLPVSGALGVHFALDPGRGRGEVPVRSVIVGAVVAVALMVSTLTFASSLNTLVSSPPLYGWNWNYVLSASNNLPLKVQSMLQHDPRVAAWSGVDYTDAQIDGRIVPILLARPGAPVMPPILSGHGLRTNHQIVLGAATMAMLGKRVGQTVTVSYGSPRDAPIYIPPTTLTIVGTATFPAVGFASYVSEHTSMGIGALEPLGIEPPAFARAQGSSDPNLGGPNLVFVRTRPGVSANAGLADMQSLARVATALYATDHNAIGNSVSVLGVQRPIQIVNYRSIGSTPLVLAVGLALGAVAALGLTLTASVRRRRRDLALLKTLGFTRRQVASAVAFQSSVDGVVGAVVGIPLGVVLGRWLWDLFARSINAVPDATVPVLSVVLVGLGTIVVANLAAALPGRSAARTAAGLVLRAE
ncbi:MAG: FtsX-like permease family protein [Acidimicrobiales bacterium]